MTRRPTRLLVVAAMLAALLSLGASAPASAAPTISVSDVSIDEPDLANELVQFQVTLSEPSASSVTVSFATADGTASFGAQGQGDYFRRQTQTLTFSPGQTTRNVEVWVLPDARDELDETFHLDLSSPSGATIADGRGTATIADDDASPSISVNDVSFDEPEIDERISYTVSLSAPSGRTVTVDFATANGTAVFGATGQGDYFRRQTQTLTFSPGQTTKTVDVWVLTDARDELDETFHLDLSNVTGGATIADNRGTTTIADDDPSPTIVVDDPIVWEPVGANQLVKFNVNLSAPSGRTVTVNFSTANGTASFGSQGQGDYFRRTSQTLTFSPGQTNRQVEVWLLPDDRDEFDETFHLDLSGATGGATIADSRGTTTITDDDDPPTVSVGDITVSEPVNGQSIASVPINLSRPSGKTITVQFSTNPGSATAGLDYTTKTNHTVTIIPGYSGIVTGVPILADNFREGDEVLHTSIVLPVNATLLDGNGTVTIGGHCYDKEPNTFATAMDLGSIAGDVGFPELFSPLGSSICPGETDWYKVQLREDSTASGDNPLSALVGLEVADGAINGDLDLFVYDADGTFYNSSESTGTADEEVFYQLPDTAAIDTAYVYVAVAGFSTGAPATNDYRLKLTGNW
ncbi:MAG: hypothetical protein M3340_02275 [Actinomycetota bacterium]|nr:hypothetical protein [Actinomycetota bacterium]